jgi:hypothetical protein
MTWAAHAPSSELVLTSIEPGAEGTSLPRWIPVDLIRSAPRSIPLAFLPVTRLTLTPHTPRRGGPCALPWPAGPQPPAPTPLATPRLGETTSCQHQPSAWRGPDALGKSGKAASPSLQKAPLPRRERGWGEGSSFLTRYTPCLNGHPAWRTICRFSPALGGDGPNRSPRAGHDRRQQPFSRPTT